VSEGKFLPRIWMPEGVKRNRFHPDDRVRATLSACGRGACAYLQQIPLCKRGGVIDKNDSTQ
jgi:hypothetical protein